MNQKYKLIDHTADIAIEVRGKDKKSLFMNCGRALFDLMYDTEGVIGAESYNIEAEGENIDELLINFLRELFFKIEIYKALLKDVEIISIDDGKIVATVTGEVYNAKKHTLKTEIKAVTYHDVKIEETGGGLKVNIVFDI